MVLVQLTGWAKARLCLSSAPWGQEAPARDHHPVHLQPAAVCSTLSLSASAQTPVQSSHAAFPRAPGSPRHRPQLLGGHTMSPPGTPLLCTCRLHLPDFQPQEMGAKPSRERTASFVPLSFSCIACKQNRAP